jgi:hypothetical protein
MEYRPFMETIHRRAARQSILPEMSPFVLLDPFLATSSDVPEEPEMLMASDLQFRP